MPEQPESERFTADERFAVACALRDWIHEQPWSECGLGADTCPDWPKAFEIRDVALSALPAPVHHEDCEICGGSGSVRVHSHEDYGVSFECEECEACAGTGKELPAGAIHVDVCPGCAGPGTWHGLDAPYHCQCGYLKEQFIPAIYVPLEIASPAPVHREEGKR